MLNWSIEAIIALISIIPLIGSFLLVISIYKRYRNQFLGLLSIDWLLLTIFWLLTGLSFITLNRNVFIIAQVLTIPIYALTIIVFDLLNHDGINPLKFSIFAALLAIQGYLLFVPGSIEEYVLSTGAPSFRIIGPYRIVISISALYAGLVYFYNIYRIYKKSPQSIKKYAFANLIGSIIFAIVPAFIFIVRLTDIIPGVDIIVSAIGLFISAAAIYSRPEQLYVLPFRAQKLSIIQQGTGLTIFNHDWDSDFELNEDLYSGILEGIRGLTNEVFKFGDLSEINFENGKLIIQHQKDEDYYFVLLSTKSSSILKAGLNAFSDDFRKIYTVDPSYDFVEIDKKIISKTQEIVKHRFAFIPEY